MKRFLPVILLILGVGVLTGAFLLIRRNVSKEQNVVEEETIPQVALADRPVTSLTPSKDGHWLELDVTKINKIQADSMDYELLYSLPDGRQQGVPGTIKLAGITKVERDLLLGSESSGKYRYDEGVEKGTLTLRFRNSSGKLVAKFSTQFHLQSSTNQLTSIDGKFSYALNNTSGNEFLVTMETFGYPGDAPGTASAGPYGVFKAVAKINIPGKGALPITNKVFPGTVNLSGTSIYRATSSGWEKLTDGKSDDVGIFIGTQ